MMPRIAARGYSAGAAWPHTRYARWCPARRREKRAGPIVQCARPVGPFRCSGLSRRRGNWLGCSKAPPFACQGPGKNRL